MKTKFRGGLIWRGLPKAPSKKDGPEPTPIPIKLVADPPPPVELDNSPPKTNRTDDFYLGECATRTKILTSLEETIITITFSSTTLTLSLSCSMG
jgi:hypothetical protein